MERAVGASRKRGAEGAFVCLRVGREVYIWLSNLWSAGQQHSYGSLVLASQWATVQLGCSKALDIL